MQCLRRSLLAAPRLWVRSYGVATEAPLQVDMLSGDREGIVVVGLNRGAARNSINKQLLGLLEEAIQTIAADSAARVVIVRSLAPGIFCAGADLKERAKMLPAEVAPFVARLRQSLRSLQSLPQPTIAALDGTAVGGGMEMALACDMRVAAHSASMGLVETKLAIIPGGGGTQNLPRLVGPALAKELIFTGRVVTGEAAASMGLVNHSVPQNESGDAAYERAVALAEEVVPQGPVALRAAKIAISRGIEVDLYSGYAFEEAAYSMVIPTKDRLEALKAFKEKRKPNFKGE